MLTKSQDPKDLLSPLDCVGKTVKEEG